MLVIKDTGKGSKTVIEDPPAVLRRIEHGIKARSVT
jgi:hypothetical protein